jgi:cyclic pyranopterin phosphate synthase
VSVIDRCNFRCNYCMPEKETRRFNFLSKEEWLSFEEIARLVKLFVGLGVRKVRLTGGEPLLRPDLPELVGKLAPMAGIEDLALTTNGSLLAQHARGLKAAGLKRLTVSLDTLDAQLFKALSGGRGDLAQVLEGIKAAEYEGFASIKINVVIQNGVNEFSILPLVERFRNTHHVLRFIEYMDVGNCNHWSSNYVLASAKIKDTINRYYPLEPVDSAYLGEVAERYRYKDGKGEIGFVSSVSQPFCRDCTRARLSASGELLTCLFAAKGTDLRKPLRNGAGDEELLEIISRVWQKRTDRYSELRGEGNPTHKVEMFQIGG